MGDGVLIVIATVALTAYTVSLTCCLPVLVVGWVYGVRPGWHRTLTVIGWGAVAVVAFAILSRRV